MRAGCAVLLVILLCAVVPAKGAPPQGDVRLGFTDASTLVAEVDAAVIGADALQDRQRFDVDGNGHVDAAEAQASVDALEKTVANVSLGLPIGVLYLDGMPAETKGISITRTGAEGPVDREAPLVTHWRLEYTFATDRTGAHVLDIDAANRSTAGFLRVQTTSVLLSVPPGHVLNGTAGLPWGATTTDDGVVFTGGFPDSGWLRIGWQMDETRDAAGAFVVPVLAIGLAMAGQKRASSATQRLHNRRFSAAVLGAKRDE